MGTKNLGGIPIFWRRAAGSTLTLKAPPKKSARRMAETPRERRQAGEDGGAEQREERPPGPAVRRGGVDRETAGRAVNAEGGPSATAPPKDGAVARKGKRAS